MIVTFDSNVLVYAVDTLAGESHTAAMGVLDRASRANGVLLLQSMAEFFRVTTAKLGFSAPDARSVLARWRAVFPVHAADEAAFNLATAIIEDHRIAFWDAMIVAAAREAGCGVLLSEDLQDGRTIAGVQVLNPFDPANAARLDAALEAP